jgi:hypothetical protein
LHVSFVIVLRQAFCRRFLAIEEKEQTMKALTFVGFGLISSLSVGCKMSGASSSETASNSQSSVGCQLSAAQVAQLSAAREFQEAEKVNFEALSAAEQSALQGRSTNSSCSSDQVSALGESFPSIASALSTSESGTTAVAGMALMGDLGMPGVVRTEYIVVPKAGSRYLAGYNSDGIMVLLLRLMQHRPR